MQKGFRWLGRLSLPAALLVVGAGATKADCIRHVYNRSPLVLVGSQDGGPSFTIWPGSSRAVRLSEPGGTLALSGRCARFAPTSAPGIAVEASFRYTAVLDRCFVEFGDRFFDRELGRGFAPREAIGPFAVNNPKPGDVVLYAERAVCGPR